MPANFPRHALGPASCTETPSELTATVTGMSRTSNSYTASIPNSANATTRLARIACDTRNAAPAHPRATLPSATTRDSAASKTNCAANLPSQGRSRIANRYTTRENRPKNRKNPMRLVRTACIACFLSSSGLAAAAPAAMPLHECRLEHPLSLMSVAARCGLLKVAEDPLQPAGRAILLRVAVIPALNRRAPAAPLFLLAGGPGQSATDLYVSNAGAFARVNRNHDIVLVDQRGTGASSPLFCNYPDDWRDTSDAIPALRQATRACLSEFGDRVRYYTSSIAVRDLDQVRGALGY